MADPQFIHLRLHTEYSLVDGLVRIKPLMKQLASLEMPAVALTDQSNLFAMVKFYRAALGAGIKPLLGLDGWLFDPEQQKVSSVVLLCQNETGYLNLSELISQSYIAGQRGAQPCISREWLAERNEGLIALSGGVAGEIGQTLLSGNPDQAERQLAFWQRYFPDRFYLELQRTGREGEPTYLEAAVELAIRAELPVVATNDVRFIHAEDFHAHEARVCIHDGNVLNDKRRPRKYSAEQYLKSAAEMAERFADLPEALENTVEIAKRCNLTLKLGQPVLPDFPIPPEMTTEAFFAAESRAGLEERFRLLLPPDTPNRAEKRQLYVDRLERELGVINQMGFPGYFLIVADFIRWAKDNDIPVGPGRGSGAGSLVAYALKITDLDPLAYDLLFERFLNPERVSMPDFDVDFCMENRDRVIDYVARKYGRDKVSQIITYGSMAAKAVVRDVGRVLGHTYGFVDRIAKLVPFELGITLEKALADAEDLRKLYESDEEVTALIDLARKLEGLSRNAGKHAGGVVIAPTKLTDFAPLYCEPGGANLVTQFDKDDVEAVGLVKFDFLGLRTLTIIDWAVKAINGTRAHGAAEIDINLIPLDDGATFELLKAQRTTAVFQLESRGMKDLIRRLQPDVFEDIIALVALFRPGPLQSGMVDDFIARKHGKAEIVYPHPDLAPILKPTYGIILYQEQVMQIAQVLANYSLGAADLLRRAMGKKKPEEMAKQRDIFLSGSAERGVEASIANYIFDLMEKFAGYGFNKSHSAAYALLSYQTAWLKAHYPAQFMASVLSSDMDKTDKVVTFIDECREMGLEVLPPDVNRSAFRFGAVDTRSILYGLGAIKGVGEGAIDNLLLERQQHGPFKSLDDLCRRIDTQKTNRRVLEALIKAGALDAIGPNRASLMAGLTGSLQRAEQYHRDAAAGQVDLFGGAMAIEVQDKDLEEQPEWEELHRLQEEKETLGLYLTGHPIRRYLPELTRFITRRLSDLGDEPPSEGWGGGNGYGRGGQEVVVAGMIVGLRMRAGRNGKMAFVTLDDQSGRVEISLFGEEAERYRNLLIKDNILVAGGTLSYDDFSSQYRVRAKELFDIGQARGRYARGIDVTLARRALGADGVERLHDVLTPFLSGSCPLMLHYSNGKAMAALRLGDAWRVHPTDECLDRLRKWAGDAAVAIRY